MYLQDRNGKALLECSDDGINFKKVLDLNNTIYPIKLESAFDVQFEPVTARYFRLVMLQSMHITEISLKATQLINNYASLNGFSYPSHNAFREIAEHKPDMIIEKNSILNLTPFMDEHGVLKAKLPEGQWTIFRFGYTSTGATNRPVTKWGIGLECDKFSREAVKLHYDSFVKKVVDNVKDIAPNTMQFIEIDSYEVGGQNWTDGFAEVFHDAKGYDIIDFLPIFTGRYMDSYDVTTGVIWDMNKLFCDLITENYYEIYNRTLSPRRYPIV